MRRFAQASSGRRSVKVVVGFALLGIVACGGGVTSIDGTSSSSGGTGEASDKSTSTAPSATSTATVAPTSTTEPPAVCKTATQHRATAAACDGVRPVTPDPNPTNHPFIKCTKHSDCTDGKNGRCTGNPHDGWQCTYDLCQADADCKGGQGLCECGGGFRSDNDVCLDTGCHVDADCVPTSAACGTGFCSPSLGSCGHYGKAVGYFCHTAKDECTNDSDCAGEGQFGMAPYCKYEPSVGHWKCSTQECAG